MRIVYLHGFASSPKSRKATVFSDRLRQLGYRVDIPALDGGDFRGLTITGQLQIVERTLAGDPAALIGSSLGGYLAALYAARHPEIKRLILMAPAFHFASLWDRTLTPEQKSDWRAKGFASLHHYGTGENAEIGYELLEDAARYEPAPDFSQPALIFHGNEDRSVPVESSIEFAAGHPNVRLVQLTSGHELTDVLDRIWQESEKFIRDGIASN